MVSSAYRAWVRDGRPWKVSRPLKAVGDRLAAQGYTIYYLGSDDARHLQAPIPEDHCPFSATGWPYKNPYPWVCGVDIMPPPRGSGLPSLQRLGSQLFGDKMAGRLPWLKYMNWEPDRDDGGACWHDSWMPHHNREPSTDRGHIHLSGCSDCVADPRGDKYDLLALVGHPLTPAPEDTMPLTADDARTVWYGVAFEGKGIADWLVAAHGREETLAKAANAAVGDVKTDLGVIQAKLDAALANLAAAPAWSDAQIAALATRIGTALVDDQNNPLTEAHRKDTIAAVKQALREGADTPTTGP